MMKREIWKPIPGYPYAVSNLGRVKRTEGGQGTRASYIIKSKIDKRRGYIIYCLCRNNKTWGTSVSHLIALAFHGPRPTKKHDAAHWDGDPSNNDPSNIRWATRKENMADADRHGRRPRGNNHPLAKLSDAKVKLMRELKLKRWTFQRLSEKFKVSQSQCYNAVRGITWGHVKCTL